jgi:YD repeat-containing protein
MPVGWLVNLTACGYVTPQETASTTAPDGTTTSMTYGAGPRLGLAAPIAASQVITVPAPARTRTQARQLGVDTAENQTQNDSIKLNTRETKVIWNFATRHRSTESPLHRFLHEDFDLQGRLVSSRRTGVDPAIGLDPLAVEYDDSGRLKTTKWGVVGSTQRRVTGLTYYPDGRLETITDGESRVTRFLQYDGAGRVTKIQAPDLRVTELGYDDNGNLTSVKPPGKPEHILRYTQLDRAR